jgi:hypothetical protein
VILNQDIIEQLLFIIPDNDQLMDRFALQEIQRISTVLINDFSVLINGSPYDPVNNIEEWKKYAQNYIIKDLNSISDYVGVQELGEKLDVATLLNHVYEIEFNPENFIKVK